MSNLKKIRCVFPWHYLYIYMHTSTILLQCIHAFISNSLCQRSIIPPESQYNIRVLSFVPSLLLKRKVLALVVHCIQTSLFMTADEHGKHVCLTDNNCPHYSKCVENRCTCRFELIGNGEKCKAGKPINFTR